MPKYTRRSGRKLDLLSFLLILVAVGVSVTLAYQVHVYYGGDPMPIARQSPRIGALGG